MSDDDLYQSAIVAVARTSEQYPRLEAPEHTCTIDNPLCGDRVTVDVRLGDDGTIAEVGQRVRGCLLCEASGVLIAKHAVGVAPGTLTPLRTELQSILRSPDEQEARDRLEALGAPWDVLAIFLPVRDYKSRHECVLLPFEALNSVLEEN